jgi:hypothetical protein
MNKLINWLVFLVILIPGYLPGLYLESVCLTKIPMHFDINGNADRLW